MVQHARTEERQEPSVDVVTPAYNEAGSLPIFLGQLLHVVDQLPACVRIIIVDDGSSDGTWEAIRSASDTEPRVRGIALSRNFGKDAAILAGLAESDADAVVVIDGDGQHPPDVIPALLEAWQAGAHVVEGVKRNRPDQSLAVRAGAQAFNRVFTKLTDVELVEATDLRLLSREARDALLSMPERSIFFRGTSTWIGFDRARVEFEVAARIDGASKFSLRSLARFAIRSLMSYTAAPLHLVNLIGVAFGLLALVVGVDALVTWASGDAVEGFTTVILLLLILGSSLLLGLGVIGAYIARIHDEVKGRPRYLVARRTGARNAT